MHGFFLIDKPKGVTSFLCVKKLRRLTGMKKAGFAGTLDPLASGLMILAVGEATKMISYLEKADKVYEVKIKLGEVSNTYDGEGEIKVLDVVEKPSRVRILEVLEDDFTGEKDQVPPNFSAIWVDGKRAYDLARKKKDFELKSRRVHFYESVLKSYSWPYLRAVVHCSSGTYIRSFADDLGRILGCGGYVDELRRLKVDGFSVKKAVKLDDLTKLNVGEYLVRVEEMFSDFARMELTAEQYDVLKNGGFIDNKAGFGDAPVLAMFEGVCVGVLGLHKGMIKFDKRFNLPCWPTGKVGGRGRLVNGEGRPTGKVGGRWGLN